MEKIKKRILSIGLLTAVLFFNSLFGSFIHIEAAASNSNSHITPYKDPDSAPTKRYVVAFMYADIWKNSRGQWYIRTAGDAAPDQVIGPNLLNSDYSFSFPGRTVRDVEVHQFSASEDKHIEYFNESRQGDPYSDYALRVGTVTSVRSVENKRGIGSDTVTFNAGITGKLTARVPYDIIHEEEMTQYYDSNIEARRYYFPLIFEFTLDGQLDTGYFTTDGRSLATLDSTGTFRSTSESLQSGRTYSKTPPVSSAWKYAGYKLSKTDDPPSGAIIERNPESIRYDGSYDKATLIMYYEPKAGAEIRHYTTTGQSLRNVAGFEDQAKSLQRGNNTILHTSGNEQYRYVGYKESKVGVPSGDDIQSGDPSIRYDGTYPTHYINFYYEGSGGSTIGECSFVIGQPSPFGAQSDEVLDPQATGVIRADLRDAEAFDVLQGIPTSEDLYVNAFGLSHLHRYNFGNMKGQVTFTVPVRKEYKLFWTTPSTPATETTPEIPGVEMSDRKVVNENITITRDFSYWQINNLEVYKIAGAEFSNYALPNGKVELDPNGYTSPVLSTANSHEVTDHVKEASCRPVDLGAQDVTAEEPTTTPPSIPEHATEFSDAADGAVGENQAKNDKVIFNESTIMSEEWTKKNAPMPGRLPQPTMIDRDVLYGHGYTISNRLENRANTPGSGKIDYALLAGNVGGGADRTFDLQNVNTVTVHTPVVNYSSVTDDQAHNQKTTPNYSRAAFILDRPFTLRIPTNGQHLNIPGYGNRDYAKYFRTKQVSFPFGVYTADKSIYYEKGTWIDIPVGQLDTTFFLPVWIDEGDYTVQFRNIAENAPEGLPYKSEANLDLFAHVATDRVDVEVIGRLYDFHITDVADYNWEMVFRTMEGSATHTGNTYWTGLFGIDGAARGNVSPFTLPILPGSNPVEGTKNVSVKTGYHIKFDLKTKGNMFGKMDGIRITPSFTFASKDGKVKTPVDLYYNDDHRTFIKVGSPEDTQERYVILNDRLRNVPDEELRDTARYKYDHYYTFAEMNSVSREMFISDYIRRFTKEKTPVGGFDLILLPEQIRTLIGPKNNLPSSVDHARANAAMQKWYGQYSLPGDPYVVEKGTNLAEYGRTHGGLTRRDPIFLRDGYIVLNFNIESIREGNLGAPHLQYINAPLMNQWTLEGFKRTVKDSWNNTFSLMDGDIVFYNADKSYKDDFQAEVPH
ncbi:DUF5704 domain-containing protein [Saccharibacillus sacchari]|uniref:DUF5704 domain-containing protein n=1 Tax=Saccharibacillus sacchari TaxID=456493 RepID=UPI000683FC1D|nr:DUF5704 domain-containing protein [Saccharibacillus sacchari]